MDRACRWATWHWLSFDRIRTPDTLDLSPRPIGAASWKLGPDGSAAPDGTRLPSNVWCAVALFPDAADAERAFEEPSRYLPFLAETVESWHALLLPVAHRGECNHLDREAPGPILTGHDHDPGGPLLVMTTAGFVMGPQLDMARVFDFRNNVDRIRAVVEASDGNTARQVFAPHTLGDDGVTMSVWRDDATMSAFAYRAGEHRAQIDRYKREQTADRTSFTRFRAMRTSGSWNGCCPVEAARA